MTREIICPNCRSTLLAVGSAYFSASGVQSLPCPVCNFPIWLDSGFFPVPTRWEKFNVITRREPTKYFEDFKKEKPAEAAAMESVPKESAKTVYSDFKILPEFITDPLKNVGQGVYKIGLWAIVVLVLVAFIIWRIKK